MTRFIHDQFTKQYLTELFTPYGQVDTSKDITSEVRQIDVLFTPASPSPDNIETLGMLGKMGIYATSAIFEPFRNAVSKSEIRSCMGKLFDIHADLERQAKRNNTRINETQLPYLWILTPTASPDILESFNVTVDEKNWSQGVYFLGKGLKTVIVTIHQLPNTAETLFLRVLGRGKVQKQAVEELEKLSKSSPFLNKTIQLVYELIAVLSARQSKEQDIDQDDQELIMKLSEIYQQQLEEIKQEGVLRERCAMIESILQVRFGEIDPQLATIIDQLAAMSREEFTPILLQLSREELLARFTK